MCEFCVKHGEGKKWYLNVKNYSYDLLRDASRRAFVKNHFYWIDKNYKIYNSIARRLPLKFPLVRMSIAAVIKGLFLYKHWSQVIPIEDVEKILAFTNSITRAPCVCRAITKGKEERFCFFISLDPNKIGIAEITDFSFFGAPDVSRLEKVEKNWALNFMKKSEAQGMLHTIWAVKAPFAGILCNCDVATGCIPMKMLKDGASFMFRAEYVAEADLDKCVGCRECVRVCQFGAISFDKKTGKIEIDPKKCYGCGICRSVCKKTAISLKDRRLIPEAANLW